MLVIYDPKSSVPSNSSNYPPQTNKTKTLRDLIRLLTLFKIIIYDYRGVANKSNCQLNLEIFQRADQEF